jgi:hypothetical protein
VGAGPASSLTDVVNDEVLTFLRRAAWHHLESVAREDLAHAIDSGRSVTDDVRDVMVEGRTRGYPFLIQLVGAVWRCQMSVAAAYAFITALGQPKGGVGKPWNLHPLRRG